MSTYTSNEAWLYFFESGILFPCATQSKIQLDKRMSETSSFTTFFTASAALGHVP